MDKNAKDLWIHMNPSMNPILLLLTVHSSDFHPSPPFKHIQTMVFTGVLNEILGPFHPETNPLLVDEKSAPRKDITNSRGNSAAFNSSVNFGLMSWAWADGEGRPVWNSAWSREKKSRHFVLFILKEKCTMCSCFPQKIVDLQRSLYYISIPIFTCLYLPDLHNVWFMWSNSPRLY